MANILLIDQQPLSTLGAETALRNAGHDVIGVARNGLDGLTAFRTRAPDLVVLELDIPKLGGLDVIKRIVSRKTDTKVLVLTALPADVYEHLCLAAGAAGFVSKDDTLETFLDAVAKALSGRTYFQAKAIHLEAGATAAEGAGEQLTAREVTVLRYLAEGYRVKQIAGELALSDRTVSTYKTRLLEKTGTHSLVELLQVAAQRGLLDDRPGITAHDVASEKNTSRFAALLDKVPYPICLRAPDGRILATNQAFLNYLGLTQDEVLNTWLRDQGIIDEEHILHARATFEDAVKKRIPYMMLIPMYLRGQRRVIRHSGHPVLDENGELLGMLCTSVNLDEEAQKIQTLRNQVSYFSSLQKRRGIYLLQHGEEVANLIANARMILQGRQSQDYQGGITALLDRIQDAVQMVTELVRMEQGEVPLTPFPENLNHLTQESLKVLPGDSVPAWTLITAHAQPHGWIDPSRYAYLLKALLLHMKHVGAASATVRVESFEREAGHLEWTLNVKGTTAPDHPGATPVLYLALADKLCDLLHGSLEIVRDDDQAFEAVVTLSIPIASMQPVA